MNNHAKPPARRRPVTASVAGFLAGFLIALLAATAGPATAADYYWDTDGSATGNNVDGTNLGGTGTWDTSTSNWWDLTNLVLWPNLNTDRALFTYAYTPGLPTYNTVTVSSGIIANRLDFLRSGYTLTGGDLTLAGTDPTLFAGLGTYTVIDSLISGSAGLIKTGGGAIRLGNTGNNYTGATTISNGALIITDQGALGADSSPIVVTGFNPVVGSTQIAGYSGGSLVLDGSGGDITISRDLSLQGLGPISLRGAALISTGVNTLSGTVDMGVAYSGVNVSTRMVAADGSLNLTGTLNVLGAAGTTISSLGGYYQAGASFYNLTGVLAGTGTLESSGGGTLFLNPSDSSGFDGVVRVGGTAASGQSVVRIDSPNVLGTRTSSTTSAVLDLNGGVLAVLMDSPSVQAGGVNANVYFRGSSTIFADHTPNSSVKDQTVSFGNMSYEDNITMTFNSRNGYGMSFTTAPVNGGDNNNTITNNLQGGALLSFTGNFWSNGNNTGNRTMTIGGNGNTLINGSIVAAAAAYNHVLTKTGTGTLTLTGTASTLDGAVNVNGGTVAVNDFRAITNNTSNINIGTSTTSATFAVVGNNVAPANLTTSKVFNLAGTTGGATLLANQTGTSGGVILNANFTATGAGAKTLTLGGSNLAANTINGAIVNSSSATSVTKIDPGTWVLAGNNTYTGATTISNGTLRLQADAAVSTILADTSAITFGAVNGYAGGTLEFVGQASANNVETLGAINYSGGGAATVKLTPGSGGTASLVFSNINTGGGGTINFIGGDFTNNTFTLTQINSLVGSDGIITRSVFWNGADYAYRQGGVLRAPVYGVDGGTATSGTALTSGSNNEVTGSFATNSISVPTIRFNGAQTLTINDGQTLTLTGAGVLATGGGSIITGATLATGTAPLVARVNGGADSLRIESAITGTGGLTKSGEGTLVLAGANTRTGLIKIAEGTVRLASGGTLGGAAALTIHQAGILELNGLTPTNNIEAFINNGIVRNTSSTTDVTLTVGGSNGAGTSYGIIEDGGLAKISVVKIGTGGQSWLGLSTYTGTTTIGSTGIVTINNLQNGGMPSGIGASSSDAGNLIFNGFSSAAAGAAPNHGGISYTGATNDETDRLFTFDGDGVSGPAGARILASGANHATSTWTNTGALAFGPNATGVAQGLTLGGTSTGDNRFFPIINDNGATATSVNKVDAGVWHLEATNGYTGATTLYGGTLYANDGTSLPTASNLVFSGGNLATSGTFSRTIGSGAGEMQWTAAGSGGFSAAGTPLTVDWGSGNVWGTTAGFLGTGALFLNNSALAKGDVTIVSDFDLGGGARTVTVGDFTSIGADFATIAGDISGTGSLTKSGAGILNLRGDNTYTGVTTVTQGTLVVESLGNSASLAGTATSVGISGIGTAFDNTNAITLGNGTTTGGILEHVGPGEVSDRKIRLNTTTGSNQIHADGTGPLILTNVANDMTAGAKLLYLRGVNSGGNMVTSQLSDNGGTLGVVVDSSTSWILTGANDYTGTTTVTGGALGIGSDTALGTGLLSLTNGNVFAYGGDRTLSNAVTEGNSTGAVQSFIGDYSLTFNGAWTNPTTTASGRYTRNNIVSGKFLTINGDYTFSGVTTGTNWNFDGTGDTIINGVISNSAGTMGITYGGTGSLTLGGANTYNGTTTLANGTLKLGANEVIPHGSGKGNVSFTPGTGVTATLDMNGQTETVNGIAASSLGTAVIDNSSGTAASLIFGDQDQTVAFTGEIKNTGSGPLSLTKTGAGAATFTGGPFAHTGSTSVNAGTLTFANDVSATTTLSVTGGSTLLINGGFSGSTGVTSLTVDGGSTLTLSLDSAGTPLSNLNTLSLGTGTGTATLRLNIGDGETDTVTLLTGGSLSLTNTVTFNMSDSGLSPSTTYTLLNLVDGGITAFGTGNMVQGLTPGGFDSMTWFVDNNLVQITTGNLVTGTYYWRSLTDATWNGAFNNWSTDKAGTIPGTTLPGAGIDVIFAYDGASGALATTLEQNFKIQSLTFESGASTPTSVSIASGADPTFRLQVAPTLATDGVKITAGGPAAVTISAPFKLGADQTWSVVDAASTLTFGGQLQGEQDVTVSGAGKIILGAAANGTFNPGLSSDFTITGGNLEMTNAGALGTTIGGNVANVILNGGAFYLNNATSGTVNNPVTLNGGTLSAGGATQTYNGAINVSAPSFINMADSNGDPSATARSITLSGLVSGSGSLTIDSSNAASGGNQIGGTLTINNAGSSWAGDLLFNRGTVTIATAASPSVTPDDVTFNSFGRLILQGVEGQTIDRAGTLSFAAGAVGEFQVDNTTGVQNADFSVNQNGAVTLGSGGTGATMRVSLADTLAKLNIAGGVTLGGNSSISVSNNAARLLTISGIIGDGGSGYGLAINDDAGGWAQTNGIVRLTGLNTFTGNVTVASGFLEFDSVSGIGGAASALGRGSAIDMAGGTLRYIGDTTSHATNRPITTSAAATLSANGTNGAAITYTGPITVGPTGDGTQFYLTGAPGSQGFITGGITETGDSADAQVTGGTWTHKLGTSRVGDELTVTGASTILNLNSGLLQVRDEMYVVSGANLSLNGTGVLSFNTATLSADASLRAYSGGTITLAANDPVVATEFDSLRIGTDGDGLGTLNMGSFNQTVTEFTLGNRNLARQGLVTGTGTLTVNGNFDVYDGTIHANLASTGSGSLEKIGSGTVTFRGNNSGLAATGANIIYAGTLALDYTASNTTKLRSASALDMRGGTLQVIGNNSAATSETVGSFTLAYGGSNTVQVTGGTGQNAVLNLGAITRGNLAQDGTVRFILPSGTQSAANGITTTSPNSFFGMLGTGTTVSTDSAYATVDDGTGVWFATGISNGTNNNIVALISTAKDDVSTWTDGDHITDSAGFTGTLGAGFTEINSLRFNAASGSDLVLDPDGILVIDSGGFLLTSNVGGTPSLLGGTLASGAAELVITQDSSQTFEIGSAIRLQGGVTKTGAGTLLLSGTNDYRGQTEIQDGALQVTGNSIGDNSLVTLAYYRDSTLELLANETIGRLQGGQRQTDDDHGLVAIGAHTLTINQTGSNTSYSGVFTGTGGIVKQGTHNLPLYGISTGFTGVVTIDSGALQLATSGQINASIIRINKGGALEIINTGTTSSTTRILDTTPVTLNSADGAVNGAAARLGLSVRSDHNSNRVETIGTLNFNSGASYLSGDANVTTGNARAGIAASDFVRFNSATAAVRARNLGTATTHNIQFEISDATNESNFINAMTGGAGADGTSTISIVPWVIGETHNNTALAVNNMGNSLVTYRAGLGFRPLDLGTEYASYGTPGATQNVRESLTTDATGLPGRTLNALVLHNDNTAASTINITGSGAGQSIFNTSGAFLLTLNPAADASSAHQFTVSGFDDGIAVGGGEYLFHVVNPSAAADTATLTVQVDSPLTSNADITKSGRGDLILTNTSNTAGGGSNKTTLNEGALEIDDLDNIGGNTGGIGFAGGTLRFGAGLTDDVSIRPLTFLQGGGTIDTNGNDFALANAIGNGGPGGFTKAGAGTLTLNAAADWLGATTVSGGTLLMGAVDVITPEVIVAGGTLDLNSLSPTFTNLTLGPGAASTVTNGTLTVTNVATLNEGSIDAVLTGPMNLIKAGAGLTADLGNTANTYTGYTWIQGGTLSVSSLANLGAPSSPLGAPASTLSSPVYIGLEGSTDATLLYTGAGAGSSDRPILLTGTSGDAFLDSGSGGLLTWNGEAYGITPGTKELTLQGSNGTGTAPNIFAGEITDGSAVIGLRKLGTGTWELTGANTYSGITVVSGGRLQVKTGQVGLGPVVAATTISGLDADGAVLEIDRAGAGDAYVTSTFSLGTTGQSGALILRNGDVRTTTTGSSGIDLGAGGYGYFLMEGGTFTTRRLDLYANNTATSVLHLTGGTLTSQEHVLLSNLYAELTVTGGTLDHQTFAGDVDAFSVGYGAIAGAEAVASLAGAGAVINNSGRRLVFNESLDLIQATFNLNAGTLITDSIRKAATGGSGSGTFNFNGGTLTPSLDGATLMENNLTAAYVNGPFGSFAGGAVIDTDGKSVTIAQSLLAPTGNGVTAIPVSAGGSGYIGAPYVQISGDGTGATAYAVVDTVSGSATYGQVTNVVITNPGVGYTTAPTITLQGGGGSGATIGTVTIGANTSGGLTKDGLGTLTLSGATLDYTGTTTVNAGILSITGSTVSAPSTTGIAVAGGATLNLLNGVGQTMNSLTSLNLGAGGGTASLGLELGASSDSLGTANVATVANTVNFNIVPVTGFGAGAYTLLSGGIGSGFDTNATYTYSLPSGYSGTQSLSDTSVSLTIAATSANAQLYWLGAVNGQWGGFDGSGNSNWTTDLAGTLNAQASPDATTTAYFTTSNQTLAGTLATTLESAFTLNGLVFNNQTGTGPISAITIGAGAAGSLTLTPALATGGIEVQSGAPASITIGAPVVLGASQTWSVASGNTLEVSGALSGSGTLDVVGGGTVNLTGTNTFTNNVVVDGSGTTLGFNGTAALNIGVNGAQTYTALHGGTISLTAGVTVNPTSTSLKSFVIGTGGGTIDVADPAGILRLDDANQFTGIGNLTKTGPGLLWLGTAFAGYNGSQVTVNGGDLLLANTQALGATGAQAAIALGTGGRLQLYNNTSSDFRSALTVTGDSTVNVNRSSAGAGPTHTLGALAIGAQTLTVEGGSFVTSGTAGLTVGATTFTGAPTFVVNNPAAGGTTLLTFGAVDNGGFTAAFQGNGNAEFAAAYSSAGGLTLDPSFTGTVTLSGATIDYTGATTVNGGALNITGSAGAPLATTAITVGGGGALNFYNGVGQSLGALTSLSLGAGSGVATLGFELGADSSPYDSLATTGVATLANTVNFTVAPLAGFGIGNYTLLSGATGSAFDTAAAYTFNLPGGFTYGTTLSDTAVVLDVTGLAAAGPFYWRGGIDNRWGSFDAGFNSNWTTDLAGLVNAQAAPGASTTAIFSASNTGASGTLATLFKVPFAVNNLIFNNETNSGGITGVSINAEDIGSLTIASAAGIDVQTGAPASIALNTPVILGATQTWNVQDSGTQLAVTGVVSDDGNGFGITKTGDGTLALNQANTFTGTLTLEAGTLAASGSTSVLGTGAATLVLNGGKLDFNHSAALNFGRNTTIGGDVEIVSGKATPGAGVTYTLGTLDIDASTLTISGGNVTSGTAAVAFGATTFSGAPTFVITKPAGGGTSQLTLGAVDNGGYTATVQGDGNVAANGIWSGGGGITLDSNYTGTFTFAGSTNTFAGDLTIKSGTVATGSTTTNFGAGTIRLGDTANNPNSVKLTGAIASADITNPIVLQSGTAGVISVETTNNSSTFTYSGGVTGSNDLTLRANGTADLIFSSNALNFHGDLTNAGTGTGSVVISADIGSNVSNIIQSSGTSTLNLSGSTIAFSGATIVNAGTLNLSGSAGTPLSTASVTVAGGATLNLVNGAGQSLGTLATLNLGAGSGTTTLGLELGAGAPTSDAFATSTAAATANTVQLNIYALSGFGSSATYNLLTAPSGLSGATYSLGYMPGGFTYTLTPSDTLVQLGVTALGAGNLYWRGDRANKSWAEVVAGDSNWSTDLAGTLDPGASPGTLNTVIFSATSAAGPTLSTTLDNNYFIDSIQFTANPAGVTAVNIAPGTLATNSLTLTPAVATDGIDVAASAGTITISAPLVVGANQEWDVSATAASLVLSGEVSGSANVTLTNTGQVTLAADNPSYSGITTISAGTLNVGSGGSTGSLGTGNVVNNGALVFNRTGTFNVSNLISGSGTLTKTANGILTLDNDANSFAGPVTVNAGTLNFTSIGNVGGGATAMGAPTSVAEGTISLAGTLGFTGSTSQSTDRLITLTGASTLAANGTGGAAITYNGAISAAGNTVTLTGTDATTAGVIAGGITQTGTAADLLVNSGNWTLQGSTVTIADDVVVTGSNTVLNLNTTGVLQYNDNGTSNGLYARGGATVNLGANEPRGGANFDYIILADSTGPGLVTLNVDTYTITTPRLDLGQRAAGLEATITGTGTVNANNLDLYRGTVYANLANTGSTSMDKLGPGTVVLYGDNSGITSTGATSVYEGVLELNYTLDNTNPKIRAASALDMRGGTLVITGNDSATTTVNVGSLTLANGGNSLIDVNPGTGQQAVLNLGAITRGTSGGTIRFDLPGGAQSATNGITTTSPNSAFGLLGTGATSTKDAAFATVTDGTGTWFATASGGNIVALVSTAKNDLGTWAPGDHVTDETTGFTGTLATPASIHSLRFDAAGGSAINLGGTGVLTVASGGVLVTSNVSSGTPGIFGGRLGSDALELVVTNDSAQTFEITSYLDASGNPLLGNAFTKSGPGTVALTGIANAGRTLIQDGTLRISGGNSILDTSAVSLAINQASSFELLGNETIGYLDGGRADTGSLYGVVAIDGHTFTINQSDNDATLNETFTFAGVFTGNGTIIRNGVDYLSLTGNSSGFTGTLIVNGGGRVDLLGGAGALANATGYILNAGSELIFRQDQSSNRNRLSDTAPVTLNNTAGTDTVAARQGLWLYNNQNATRTENTGPIILGAGHNLIRSEPNSTGTSCLADLVADTLARNNRATLLVRGLNLGASSGRRGLVRFDSGGQATLNGYEVGGGATSGTKISIIPFMVGDDANDGLGESFVTNVDGTVGLRPLTTSEYVTDAAGYNGLTGAATDNVRFATNPGGALTGTATAINSLVLDSASAITLTGPASDLEITSGAILSVQAGADVINTFTGITTGAFRDYTVFVTTATGSLTIDSPLTTAAPLVKAGGGSLILGNAGNQFTNLYFNQGVVQADALAKLGTGALNFFGGTLRFGAAFDPSSKAITIGTGGARFDTNGFDITLANAIGNGGSGDFTKTGNGILTLSAAPTYTGNTWVQAGAMNFATIDPGTTSTLLVAGNSGTVSSTVTSGLNVQSLVAGGVYSGTANSTGNLTVNGGAVTIGDGSSDDSILIGYRDVLAGNGVAGNTVGNVDFSAASSVTIDVDSIALGYHPQGGGSTVASGNLTLSNTSNTVTARAIVMGDSASPGMSTPSTIALGTGATTFNVDEFTIGRRKGAGTVTLGSGGTFALAGSDGIRGTNLSIADNDIGGTGVTASGTMDLSAGTADALLNQVLIGRAPLSNSAGGATGTVSFGSGSNAVSMNSLLIGQMRSGSSSPTTSTIAQGTLNFGGGTLDIAGDVTLGDWSDDSGEHGTAKGTLNLTGGTVSIAGNIGKTDSDRSAGMITVDGAAVDLQPAGDSTPGTVTASQLNFLSGSIANAGTVTLDGRGVTNGTTFAPLDYALVLGDVNVSFDTVLSNATAGMGGVQYAGTGAGATVTGTIDLGSVERVFDVANGAAPADLTVSGAISGAGGLTKQGDGILLLNGTNLYDGATNVNAGTLGGTGMVSGTGATIASGATLAAGDPAVASGVGTLSFSSGTDLTSNTGSTWLVDVVQDVNGSSDRLAGIDVLTIQSGAQLSFNFTGPYTPWNTYTLATYNSRLDATTFDGYADGSTFMGNGGLFQIDYGSGAITLTAVPEPETWLPALLVLGLGLFLRRRRRHQG